MLNVFINGLGSPPKYITVPSPPGFPVISVYPTRFNSILNGPLVPVLLVYVTFLIFPEPDIDVTEPFVVTKSADVKFVIDSLNV